MRGDRLTQSVSFEQLKLAAALVILSPFIPLLFMGEEYGETAPFPYFVSHSDPELIEAVRRGRREEFASFQWRGEVPDPQDEATFRSAKLGHELRDADGHKVLLQFYRELTGLRRTIPSLARSDKESMAVRDWPDQEILACERWCRDDHTIMLANIGDRERSATMLLAAGRWRRILDSAAAIWHGTGSLLPDQLAGGKEHRLTITPHAVAVYRRENVS